MSRMPLQKIIDQLVENDQELADAIVDLRQRVTALEQQNRALQAEIETERRLRYRMPARAMKLTG